MVRGPRGTVDGSFGVNGADSRPLGVPVQAVTERSGVGVVGVVGLPSGTVAKSGADKVEGRSPRKPALDARSDTGDGYFRASN